MGSVEEEFGGVDYVEDEDGDEEPGGGVAEAGEAGVTLVVVGGGHWVC